MADDPAPPAGVLARFNIRAPVFVDSGRIATVWRVETSAGNAALKVYHHDDWSGERPGALIMQRWAGRSAAEVFAIDGRAMLLEWLDGPSLGDVSRAGRDADAAQHLADVAAALRSLRVSTDRLQRVDEWFDSLREIDPKVLAERDRPVVAAARAIGLKRLAAISEAVPLHGDLHHDNIKQGPRGWSAFDAKGAIGPPAYEVANSFRNPEGQEALSAAPARIDLLADVYSAALGADRVEILEWAAAYCALSICWHIESGRPNDENLAILRGILGVLGVAHG